MNKRYTKPQTGLSVSDIAKRMKDEEPVALKALLYPSFWVGMASLFGIWYLLSFIVGFLGNNVPFFFWKFIFAP